MEIREKAYAKLNLTLAVTGVENGYHTLDSLVCTVDLFDLIKLKKRKDKLVSIVMHGQGCELIPPEKNNAYRAAEAYIEAFGTGGADITVFKNIPVGAGVGGSSADAAGVLRGMAKLYGKGGYGDLKTLADGLGSDTGYLLKGGFARLYGRGEKVENLDICGGLSFILLVPRGGVSTPECFRAYDGLAPEKVESQAAVDALTRGDLRTLGGALGNALFKSACLLNPGVAAAYGELKGFSPLGVNMTGSGGGVYALCESAAMRAYIKSRYRGEFTAYELKSVVPKL